MTEPFKGKIPAIAEKEKRGKRIKIPKNEIYVQELASAETPAAPDGGYNGLNPQSGSNLNAIDIPSTN